MNKYSDKGNGKTITCACEVYTKIDCFLIIDPNKRKYKINDRILIEIYQYPVPDLRNLTPGTNENAALLCR
jgi:hypothetical protein